VRLTVSRELLGKTANCRKRLWVSHLDYKVYNLGMSLLREAEMKRMGNLMRLQQQARGPVTSPGEDGQIETVATQFDEFGNPTVVVVDSKVVRGETEGLVALARSLVFVPKRPWRFLRRKRNPKIIGGEE